jgi:hypothetical protein
MSLRISFYIMCMNCFCKCTTFSQSCPFIKNFERFATKSNPCRLKKNHIICQASMNTLDIGKKHLVIPIVVIFKVWYQPITILICYFMRTFTFIEMVDCILIKFCSFFWVEEMKEKYIHKNQTKLVNFLSFNLSLSNVLNYNSILKVINTTRVFF